jgi:uncharacterized membrane protein YvbJ
MENLKGNRDTDEISRLISENKKMKKTIRWLSFFVVIVLIIQLYNLIANLL